MNLDRSFPAPPSGSSGWPWIEDSRSRQAETSSDVEWPRITIVTPSFNQGRFLERTIRSVLLQCYPNLEYIIVDGGSTDNSVDIIKKYEPWITSWVSEPDRGQSNAINKGFARSSGLLLSWLNSDDFLTPEALQAIAALYREEPFAGGYVGAGEFVDIRGNTLQKYEPGEITLESLRNWLNNLSFIQPSCYFSRHAWLRAGGLDESLHFSMDLDLWLRIVKESSFRRTSALVSRSTLHPSAKTTAYKYFSDIDAAVVLMRHGGEDQARAAIEKIAAKLSFLESSLSIITANPLFGMLLPHLKRITRFEKRMNALYPKGRREK